MSEAKPKPLHVNEISDLAGINVDKLMADGGYSWIYSGFEENTKKKLIVKVPFEESFEHNIKNEIIALEKLKHPSLVELISYGKGETAKNREVKYIVEEFVKGKNLWGIILGNPNKYKPNHINSVDWMYKICHFLKHVHDNDLVYIDCKLNNMILLPDNTIKFIDLATVTKSPYDCNGLIAGTVGFVSPDILASKLDHRSDIYVAGIIFYTMLMGEIPFDNSLHNMEEHIEFAENMKKHMFSPRPRIQDKAPDVPNSVSAIAYKMMQVERKKRYQSMEEVLSDLEQVIKP